MGSFEVESSLWPVLRNDHVVGTLQRQGMSGLIDEIALNCLLAASYGIDGKLGSVAGGWGSWFLTIGGTTVHLRTREYAGLGPRTDGTIYLRNAYRDGVVVGRWSTREAVRAWFDQAIANARGQTA